MPPEEPDTASGLPAPGRRRCVIVDDELRARLTLSAILERHFPDIVEVGQAATVQDSITMITWLRPDIIFLDIELIGGTGFDVLARIDTSAASIVFTTALSNYRTEMAKYPSAYILFKPIRISDVRCILEAGPVV